MRMKTQRILAALLSLVLLLALAPAGWAEGEEGGGTNEPVLEGSGIGESVSLPAAGVVLDNKNSVSINLVPKDKAEAPDQTFANEIVKAKVEADLYLIAPAVADTMYDTYSYNFTGSAFAGLKDRVNEALKTDPTKPATTREDMLKSFSPIAQAAAEIVKTTNVGTQNTPAATTQSIIDVGNLPAGMYLLILRGADLAKNETETGYFTTAKKSGTGEYADPTNPGQDVTITVTRALSDNYEFLFEPQLITLPTKTVETAQGTAQSYNTAYGVWSKTLSITAKPDWKPKNGILKITKTLTDYVDLSKEDSYFEPMTFTFSIVGRDKQGEGAKEVYKKVVALSVDSPVSQQEVVTLTDIPVGTWVTVTEIYSGAHASGEPTGQQTKDPTTGVIIHPEFQIQSPTVTGGDGTMTVTSQAVNFTNVNNDTHRGGHGIENKFTFDKGNGSWQWDATGRDGAASGNEVEE